MSGKRRCRTGVLRAAALVLASIAVSLLLFEIILRMAPPRALIAKWPNPPNADARLSTDEFSVRIRTNGWGLREPREVGPKHTGAFRIAAVGDSFTYGWGVEAEQTYPARLQAELRNRGRTDADVVNVAKPGDDLVGYLRLLRYDAMPLQPDAVVVGFLPANDCPVAPPTRRLTDAEVVHAVEGHVRRAYDTGPDGSHLRKLVSIAVAQPLRQWLRARRNAPMADESVRDPINGSRNPLDTAELAPILSGDLAAGERFEALKAAGWIEKGRRWNISPWLIRNAIESPDFPAMALFQEAARRDAVESQWLVCEGLIRRLKAETEAGKARFYLLVFPSPYQADPSVLAFRRTLGIAVDPSALAATDVNQRLAALCRREDMRCIDTLAAARAKIASGARLFFTQDGHMTAEGNALVAGMVADTITADLPLKPR